MDVSHEVRTTLAMPRHHEPFDHCLIVDDPLIQQLADDGATVGAPNAQMMLE